MILIKNAFAAQKGRWIKRDIIIDRGLYAKIEESIPEPETKTTHVIQADGRYLLPACIDLHVHVREPGYEYKEDWETCSRAALKGGFSSIFDMPNNRVPVVDYRTLMNKKEIARKKSYVNFGLYLALTEENGESIHKQEIQSAVCGIKVYLSKTTGNITVRSEESLLHAFRQPKPVLVHTGGEGGLSKLLFLYERASKRWSRLPILYLCHTSTSQEVALIRRMKKKLASIVAEVTPHHLFLNREEYRGYPAVLPPLAGKKDVDALWEGINDGTLDLIGTDHAPHAIEEKKRKDPPAGFPGLETALPLLFSAYREGRIGLSALIRLSSGKAGMLFPRAGPGVIEEGQRAESVLVEEKRFIVGDNGYESKCAWSPFDGWELGFRPVLTIVNGTVAFEDGRFYKPEVRYLCDECESMAGRDSGK